MPVISLDRSGKHDVFISYSRRDGEFVQKLHDALQAEGQNPWIDWVNIPKGVDWWQCIQSGIESAYTFVFVISPDSVASKICREELDYAVQFNKRLLPVIWRMPEFDQIPDDLKRINWNSISFEQSFDGALVQLVEGINADLEHIKFHTYLLELALTWDREGRNPDMLLRGSSLEKAKDWILSSAAKMPRPTQLQTDYITTSQEVETAAINAQAKIKRRQKMITTALCGLAGLGVMSGLSMVSVSSTMAEIGALISPVIEAPRELDALILTLRAGRVLDSPLGLLAQQFDSGMRLKVVTALHQPIYGLNEQNRLTAHQGRVYAIGYSKGKLIASAGQDGIVRLWKSDGTKNVRLTGHTKDVVSLDFSQDGQMLASGSYDGSVKLWRIEVAGDGTPTGELVTTLSGHQGEVFAVRFSPDGQQVASASADGRVKVWTWAEVKTFAGLQVKGQAVADLPHGEKPVFSLDFSPDGKTIATASLSGVRLWSGARFQKDNPLDNTDQDFPYWVRFSRDGQRLVSAGFSKTAKRMFGNTER